MNDDDGICEELVLQVHFDFFDCENFVLNTGNLLAIFTRGGFDQNQQQT